MPAGFDLHLGDCLEVMPTLAADSVDSIVTDPPYGLSFMGKNWDHGVPGQSFWAEALRVAKPGAHLLAFGGTRTYHRLACAIEDAGWEIRDCVMWVYGSGFPKSLDVSKAIDKAAGCNRPRVPGGQGGVNAILGSRKSGEAISGEAKQWQGWGTALKPAYEPIVVARKPFPGTVAANVLKHGTGAINVDGCRVGTDAGWSYPNGRGGSGWHGRESLSSNLSEPMKAMAGRWPANLIHDGSEEVLGLFPQTGVSSGGGGHKKRGIGSGNGIYGVYGQRDCPANVGLGDSGSAARFFYCAKASKADRDEGLEQFAAVHRVNGNKWTDQDYRVTSGERPTSAESGPRRNVHPTVKPTSLMCYLCRLITPPGGIVLDPFMGSGSTGKGAVLEGFRFIGIEREAEYLEIARARIDAAMKSGNALPLFQEELACV
jgi:DNA modification methylase